MLFQGPSTQEVRRRRTLECQKKRRDDYLTVARALVQGNIEGVKTFITLYSGYFIKDLMIMNCYNR